MNFFLTGFIFKGIYNMKLRLISIFWWTFFWSDSFFNFFLCCPLFVPNQFLTSPSGVQPSIYTTRAPARVVKGWMDGTDGTGGRVGRLTKRSFNFFILRYIKHYTHIYLYTKENLSGQISCGFIFWSSWRVALTIFKITLLGWHFSKMGLKVDFLEKNNRDFPLK